jgi:hypothetical protein
MQLALSPLGRKQLSQLGLGIDLWPKRHPSLPMVVGGLKQGSTMQSLRQPAKNSTFISMSFNFTKEFIWVYGALLG